MEELGSSLHQPGGVLEVDKPGEHGKEDRVSCHQTVDQPQLPVPSCSVTVKSNPLGIPTWDNWRRGRSPRLDPESGTWALSNLSPQFGRGRRTKPRPFISRSTSKGFLPWPWEARWRRWLRNWWHKVRQSDRALFWSQKIRFWRRRRSR